MSASSPNAPGPNDTPLSDSLGGVAALLDIEIEDSGPERVTATMPVTPDHHQPFGLLHGGVSVVLAESAASVGGHLAAPDGHTAVGVEINANHVRPVREGQLTATATPLHTGRTTQVWEIKIRDADAQLVCASRCTLAVVKQPDSTPAPYGSRPTYRSDLPPHARGRSSWHPSRHGPVRRRAGQP